MIVLWTLALGALLSPGASSESLGDLVGQYFCGHGDGFTWRLSIAPEGTYKFGVSGHVGYQAEAPGVARLVGTILTLEPTQPVSEAQRELPTSLQVVRWGDRVYLVPDDKGPRFADSAVHHWEPRTNLHGDFLLREPDWSKPVRGMPELPAGWRPWLIESVIEARITRSLARHRAEIGVGSRQHVSVGLILRAVSSKYG